ncbi:hypothetical protein CBM2634_B30023 [Cupriavidus taiwanensis]|uniref:Uncharacterized protein n=1 Tax=Cupriavidus taiwanensis TaxID=164546 RepID=A0A375JA22_9BURK|nr:hypothetical protein CBM2634_B30023 [Cupriavidus taiwanensis]
MASRPGDALFASFLSLGQKGGRRLRRRNSRARQARQTNHLGTPALPTSPTKPMAVVEIKAELPGRRRNFATLLSKLTPTAPASLDPSTIIK